MYARRKGEHGAAILESFLSMILIGMILFGILQLFQLVVADMVIEYVAFRGARSGAVGFKQEYAFREALIKSAPVSGPLVLPDPETYSGFVSRGGETEKSILRRFMLDEGNVEYAYWKGHDPYHLNYTCPLYGQVKEEFCKICDAHLAIWRTGLDMRMDGSGETAHFMFKIVNYPFHMPLHGIVTGKSKINISGRSELTNHSAAFLE